MSLSTLTSWECSRRASEAKQAANIRPVFITDQGRPTHVLMTFEAYQRLTEQRRNIAEALAMPGVVEIEFDAPRAILKFRTADFS